MSTSAFFCSDDVATYLHVVKRDQSGSNYAQCYSTADIEDHGKFETNGTWIATLPRFTCFRAYAVTVLRHVPSVKYDVLVRTSLSPPVTKPLLSPLLPFNLLNLRPRSER